MRAMKCLGPLCVSLALACASHLAISQSAHCSVQPEAPATDADKAFASGNFSAAEPLFAAQISAAPSPAAYLGLVRAQLEQNKLKDASSSAERAAAAFPKSGDALALGGEVLFRSGEVQPAFAAFAKALTADPCSPQAHLGAARLNLMVAHAATAARELAQAHALAPNDPTIAALQADNLPETDRAAALKRIIESAPLIPPAEIAHLKDQLAIIEQHKSCTATPYTTADIEMNPIPFSGTYARSWALKTRINDQELPLLEMDTTVSGIVLNPKDAKRAGVHPLTSLPDSPETPYLAVADKIRIGNIEYHDCPVRVVPSRELAGLNSLIGLDLFRDHLIHIDYVTRMFSLRPLPVDPAAVAGKLADRFVAPDEKAWTPVYRAGPNLLVPALVNKKGPYLFALDTGSWRTLFSPSSSGKAVTCLHDSTLTLRGVSGPIVKVLPMDGAEHQFSDVRSLDGSPLKVSAPDAVAELRYAGADYISKVPYCVDITAKSHATGVEVAGLIGFSDLSAFALDLNYRDSLIYLKYDELRRYENRELVRDH
jgi:tetratricopeptide (TPR) repeat protein